MLHAQVSRLPRKHLLRMIKIEHLLHPLRAARYARTMSVEHYRMRRAVSRAQATHENDGRYRLQNVTDAFVSHLDDTDAGADAVLLERICAAYIKATEQSEGDRGQYGATPWWRNIQRNGLSAVRQALATRDIDKLHAMYRNFFRDPCGTGLVPRPPGRAASYFNNRISDTQRRFILGESLHRIDYWRTQTGGRFPLSCLRGSGVGNPFGVLLDGTLVAAGAEFQHCCADRILSLCTADFPKRNPADGPDLTVAEIGGGFGGMAYYLLRGNPAVTYLDFDVPESLALTAYYLSKSLPQAAMLLYGEAEFTEGCANRYDVILMPPWELGKLSANSVDITFSSHALSDLVPAARAEYMREIARATRGWLLTVGAKGACDSLHAFIRAAHPSLARVVSRRLEWNSYRAPQVEEVEHLFRVHERK